MLIWLGAPLCWIGYVHGQRRLANSGPKWVEAFFGLTALRGSVVLIICLVVYALITIAITKLFRSDLLFYPLAYAAMYIWAFVAGATAGRRQR